METMSSSNFVDLCDDLPPTSDDSLSPMPSPSEMPKHFIKKVHESIERRRSQASLPLLSSKVLESPRIPPSGTPVKSEQKEQLSSDIRSSRTTVKNEPDSPSSQISRHLSDLEEMCRDEEYVQIAFLKPRFVEFSNTVPSFPKTHVDGYAHVIELTRELLNEKALLSIRDGLQYSLTNGGGPKVYENVKFFASDGQKVPMRIHSRQCAGTSRTFNHIS
jgi:hypothetical protein